MPNRHSVVVALFAILALCVPLAHSSRVHAGQHTGANDSMNRPNELKTPTFDVLSLPVSIPDPAGTGVPASAIAVSPGDLNSDGAGDIVAFSAPAAADPGLPGDIIAIDSMTGDLLWRHRLAGGPTASQPAATTQAATQPAAAPQPAPRLPFGGLAALPDLNKDGVGDIYVSHPGDAPMFTFLSGRDGALIHQAHDFAGSLLPLRFDEFGGDKTPVLVFAARNNPETTPARHRGPFRLMFYSGTTFKRLLSRSNLWPRARAPYGLAVARVPDANGVDDYLLQTLPDDASAEWALGLLDGKQFRISRRFVPALKRPSGPFSFLAPGDLDADGRADLVVHHVDAERGEARLTALNGDTGAIIWQAQHACTGRLADDAIAMPDISGDGVSELCAMVQLQDTRIVPQVLCGRTGERVSTPGFSRESGVFAADGPPLLLASADQRDRVRIGVFGRSRRDAPARDRMIAFEWKKSVSATQPATGDE